MFQLPQVNKKKIYWCGLSEKDLWTKYLLVHLSDDHPLCSQRRSKFSSRRALKFPNSPKLSSPLRWLRSLPLHPLFRPSPSLGPLQHLRGAVSSLYPSPLWGRCPYLKLCKRWVPHLMMGISDMFWGFYLFVWCMTDSILRLLSFLNLFMQPIGATAIVNTSPGSNNNTVAVVSPSAVSVPSPGQRPKKYVCTTCGKAFSTRGNLEIHKVRTVRHLSPLFHSNLIVSSLHRYTIWTCTICYHVSIPPYLVIVSS